MRRLLLISLFIPSYSAIVWFGVNGFLDPDDRWPGLYMALIIGLFILALMILLRRKPKKREPAPATWEAPPRTDPFSPAPDSAYESGGVCELFREANERLARSTSLASRSSLAPRVESLPTYLLVGAEGVGKTSCVLGSGMPAELLAGELDHGAGVVPTELANLWYARDYLFVDVGGHVFTEGLEGWKDLLAALRPKGWKLQLKKAISARKDVGRLCGIVVWQDVSVLLDDGGKSALESQSRSLRSRLQEIAEAFETDCPVYVLFSNAQRIRYFEPYFSGLRPEDYAQTLGCTIPESGPHAFDDSRALAARLTEGLERLYESLARLRVIALPSEKRSSKRGEMYEFPRELRKLRDPLVSFLSQVFRPSMLRVSPYLRGFYFAGLLANAGEVKAGTSVDFSGTVAGGGSGSAGDFGATKLFTPEMLQTVVGGQTIGATRFQQGASGKTKGWAFVEQLFDQFTDRARIPEVSRSTSRRAQLYRWGLAGAAGLLVVALAFSVVRSWWGNRELVSTVRETVGQSNVQWARWQADGNLTAGLQALEAIREPLAELTHYQDDGAPWRLGWGLYSGETIRSSLRSLYFDRLAQVAMDDVRAGLTRSLASLPVDPSSDDPRAADAYDLLKLYRMTTSGECRPEVVFASTEGLGAWSRSGELDADQLALARSQFGFYATELEQGRNPYTDREEDALVERVRRFLSKVSSLEQYYMQLRAEVAEGAEPENPFQTLAPDSEQVMELGRAAEPVFSVNGFALIQRKIDEMDRLPSGEVCVTGPISAAGAAAEPIQLQMAKVRLKQMYLRDYLKNWRLYLEDSRVRPFSGAKDASAKLELLSSNRSPLLALLLYVGANTNVGNDADNGISGEIASRLSDVVERITGRGGESQDGDDSGQAKTYSPRDITEAFQPVQAVVDSSTQDVLVSDRNRPYINALVQLQLAMDRIGDSDSRQPEQGLHNSADDAARQAGLVVQQLAQSFRLDEPEVESNVKRLLNEPIENARRFIITDPRGVARGRINRALQELCRRFDRLRGRFPFSPAAAQDVTESEMAAMFTVSSGAFWRFYTEELSKAVINEGGVWMQNPDAPDEPKLTPEFLQFFNYMAAVSSALYSSGSRLNLRPHPSQRIDSLEMSLNGGTQSTPLAAPRALSFPWGGGGSTQGVNLTLQASGVGIPAGSFNGPWGFFRLIQASDPQPPASRLIQISQLRMGSGQPQPIRIGGEEATLTLEVAQFPGGVSSMFDKNFFSRIQCPSRATQ